MILFNVFVLACLVGISAVVSLAEAAITSLSSLRMKRLVVMKPWLSRYFSEWLEKPHRILVTMLVMNNLVNVLISGLATTMSRPLEELVPPQAVEAGVLLVTTLVLLVVAEIMPKIVGRAYRERISAYLLPPLAAMTRFLSLLLAPVHWFLDKLTPGLEHAPVNRLTALSLEELNHIIRESQESGQVSSESGEMMQRVLALPQRKVAEVCQKAENVDSVAMEVLTRPDGPELFVDLMVETGRSRVPVTRDGRYIGYVNVMDVLKKWRTGEVPSIEGLVRTAPEVAGDRRVVDLLADFRRTGEHLAFVRDGEWRFLGLVTLEDALEEIVGEIVDEYDLELQR